MNSFEQNMIDEKQARLSPICPGCGEQKAHGEGREIVCWDCFKYTDDHPYKYFAGTLKEWIAIKNPIKQ